MSSCLICVTSYICLAKPKQIRNCYSRKNLEITQRSDIPRSWEYQNSLRYLLEYKHSIFWETIFRYFKRNVFLTNSGNLYVIIPLLSPLTRGGGEKGKNEQATNLTQPHHPINQKSKRGSS